MVLHSAAFPGLSASFATVAAIFGVGAVLGFAGGVIRVFGAVLGFAALLGCGAIVGCVALVGRGRGTACITTFSSSKYSLDPFVGDWGFLVFDAMFVEIGVTMGGKTS